MRTQTFRIGLSICALLGVAQCAWAGAILDAGTLATTDQGMWSAGDATPLLKKEVFLGARWGTFNGEAPESIGANLIVGSENTLVPGTGGTIPNPGWVAWQGAMAACMLVRSQSACINGTPAQRVCAPSWLGGGCVTVVPAVPGLGNEPPTEIPNPIGAEFIDTRSGLAANLVTSGEAGIIPWVDVSAGSIDAALPFNAVISMPDDIQEGVAFTLSTSAEVRSGARITAEAPSFKAGVDGVLNMDNAITGTACIIFAGCETGTVDLDINAGRFGLLSIDTTESNFLRVLGDAYGEDSFGVPGVAFNKLYNFYVPTPENPDGVDDETTPKFVPSPKLGDLIISNPQDFQGGDFADGLLTLDHYQELIGLNVSLTGIGELSLGSPGILNNKIPIVPPLISAEYSLVDVGVGPRFGVQQNFDLDPNLTVKLQFDKPIIRIDQGGVETLYGDGIVDVAVGTNVSLRFDGEVGQLVSRTYFLDNPLFSNLTEATLDPGMRLKFGCLNVTFVIDDCIFNQDFQTEGLLGIPVWDQSWILGGFNQITFTNPLDPGELPPIGDEEEPPGPPIEVPEPSSLALLGLGFALLGATRLRRRVSAV